MKPQFISLIIATFTAAAAVAAPVCRQAHVNPLSPEEISSRIDALAELRLRLQGKEFANQSRFEQSLVYFDREMAFLAETVPDFNRRYRERFQELAKDLKAQQKARKSQESEKKKERAKKIREVEIFNAHELFHVEMDAAVKNAQYSGDGKWIFGLTRTQVLVIEASTGKVQHKFETPDPKVPFNDAAFSPDSKLLAIAAPENKTLILDVITGNTVHSISHGERVTKVTFSPDSQLLLATIADSHVTAIDVATGDKLYTIQNTRQVVVSSDSKQILVSFQGDQSPKVLMEARTGKTLLTLQDTEGGGLIKFSPDLRLIVAGFGANTVRVFDAATGTHLQTIAHAHTVWRAHFSPDSKFLATASYDGTARIVDVSSRGSVHTITHTEWVNDAIWSHDSQFVATVSEDGFAFIVDMKTKSTRHKIPHGDRVDHALLNSDSTFLVTADHSGLVRIIDTVTGEIQGTATHSRYVNKISLSPDQRSLLSASDDKTLVVTKLYVSSEE